MLLRFDSAGSNRHDDRTTTSHVVVMPRHRRRRHGRVVGATMTQRREGAVELLLRVKDAHVERAPGHVFLRPAHVHAVLTHLGRVVATKDRAVSLTLALHLNTESTYEWKSHKLRKPMWCLYTIQMTILIMDFIGGREEVILVWSVNKANMYITLVFN